MMTVAMAAGVCIAVWGQGTTTVVQAGSGVTKIAIGDAAATEVNKGDAVQAAEGATVTIVGAAPAAGKVARLKLTKKEKSSSESAQTGENPSIAPNGEPGGSGTGQSQEASLHDADLPKELEDLKNVNTLNDLFLMFQDIESQLPKDPDDLTLIEKMTLTLGNYEDYEEDMGVMTLTLEPKAKFSNEESVLIIFVYHINGKVSWSAVNGVGKENGSVQTTIPASTFVYLADQTFVAFLITEQVR